MKDKALQAAGTPSIVLHYSNQLSSFGDEMKTFVYLWAVKVFKIMVTWDKDLHGMNLCLNLRIINIKQII